MPAADGRETVQQHLPDWLRAVSVDLTGELLALRSANAARVAATITATSLLEHVAFAFGADATPDFTTAIVATMREDDPTYPSTGTDRELRLIVSCAIAQEIHPDGSLASVASLAAQTAAFRGWRADGPDLQELGRSWLDEAGARQRERSSGAAALPKAPVVPAMPKPNDEQQVVFDQATLAAMLAALRTAAAFSTNGIDLLNREQTRRAALQDEEVNILWWLLGDARATTRTRWANVVDSAVPLTAARELADLTAHVPGPSGAYGFLKRVLGSTEHGAEHLQSVVDVVDAAAAAWEGSGSSPTWTPHALTPITTCVSVRSAHGGDQQWAASCMAQYGIDVSKEYPVDLLALELYDELLLRRALDLDGSDGA